MAHLPRPADDLLAPQVQATVDALKREPADAGAVQLAHMYARLIDQAVPDARYRDALAYLETLVPADDTTGRRHLQRIIDALAEHSVASDLGPKLLAVLEQLGATPRGRSLIKPAAKGSAGGRLEALRAARPN